MRQESKDIPGEITDRFSEIVGLKTIEMTYNAFEALIHRGGDLAALFIAERQPRLQEMGIQGKLQLQDGTFLVWVNPNRDDDVFGINH